MSNFSAYEALLNFDNNGNVISGVAESYSVTDDGSLWTVKLRDDVYFHSGKKLTAEDVKKSNERFLTISPNKGLVGDLSGVEAPDDRTLLIHFNSPSPSFITILTGPFFAPLDMSQVEALVCGCRTFACGSAGALLCC